MEFANTIFEWLMVGENKGAQRYHHEKTVPSDDQRSPEDLAPGHVDPLPLRRLFGEDSVIERACAGVRRRTFNGTHRA